MNLILKLTNIRTFENLRKYDLKIDSDNIITKMILQISLKKTKNVLQIVNKPYNIFTFVYLLYIQMRKRKTGFMPYVKAMNHNDTKLYVSHHGFMDRVNNRIENVQVVGHAGYDHYVRNNAGAKNYIMYAPSWNVKCRHDLANSKYIKAIENVLNYDKIYKILKSRYSISFSVASGDN